MSKQADILARGVQVKVSDEDMTVICTIIASAEYCVDVVASLGRSVAKTLEPPFSEMVCSCFADLKCTCSTLFGFFMRSC